MNSLIDLIEAFKDRGKIALKYKNGYRTINYSYQKLYDYIRRFQAYLEEQGVEPGDKIAIWAPNSPSWVIAFFGAIAAGAIAVPIDAKSAPENAARIIERSGSRLLVKSRYRSDPENIKSIQAEDIPALLQKTEAAKEYREPRPDDLAELVYTSGTTGDPKGVMISHKNLIANIEAVIRRIKVTDKDQTVSILPLSHLFEQTGDMLAVLYAGASVVYIQTIKPSAILETFKQERITIFIAVPRVLQGFKNSIRQKFGKEPLKSIFKLLLSLALGLEHGKRKKLFFFIHKKFGPHFRFFVSGGASLDRDTEEFWENLGFKVIQGYGLTECSPILTVNPIKDRRIGSAGRPLDNVEMKISESNEILARGNNIFQGYYRDKANTDAVFENGWFKTGDIGYRDNDDFYFVKTRIKDMIVSAAGINVYPEDIEPLLNEQTGIKESAIIGLPDGAGESIHAVIIPENKKTDIDLIIDRVNQNLDSSQKISGYTVWPDPELPKTTTLKVKKNILRERIENNIEGITETNKRGKLIDILAEVSPKHVNEISLESRLYADLKIDSIGRVELVSAIEREYGMDFEEELINEKTTVSGLRELIKSKKAKRVSTANHFWPYSYSVKKIRLWFLNNLGLKIINIWCRVQASGLENLKDISGPAIFAPNHASYFDHPAVLSALPEKIRAQVAAAAWDEYFRPPRRRIFFWAYKRLFYYFLAVFFGIFSLSQKNNFKKNLQFAGRLVDQGEHILIFPEGERTRTEHLLPFKSGIAVLAENLEIPVIPVGISGIDKVYPRGRVLPRKGKVSVVFGAPIDPRGKSRVELLNILKQKIEELRIK